jgi:Bacterial PH domain
MRFAPTTFRPAFGRGLSIVIAAITLAGLIGLVVGAEWLSLVRYGWAFLLVGFVGFALFWMPRLDVAESEVTVRNVFTTVHVPWHAIERIDTKYALTIYTATSKISVWASPAPTRYAAQVGATSDARLAASVAGTNPRPGDLLDTHSGAAAFVIRRHLDDLREDGKLNAAGTDDVTLRRDIHWATIALLAALCLATILGATI